MKRPHDPPRLLDPSSGTPNDIRAILEAGRLEFPTEAELARLDARLHTALPLSDGTAPSNAGVPSALKAPVAAASSAPSTLTGALVGAGLAVAVVGSLWWHEASIVRRETPAASTTAQVPDVMTAPVGSETPAPPVVAVPREASPVRVAPPPIHPSPSGSPSPPASASLPRPTTLAAELALVDETRRTLNRGDLVQARKLCGRYASEISDGQLSRDITKLCAKVESAFDAGTMP